MRLGKFPSWMLFIFFLAGCDLVSGQFPFASTPYPPPPYSTQPSGTPQSATQSQPRITGSQRGQYLWDKALEGMALGGALAGPYGAGTGLVLGLLAGLFTADAHYTQLNGQIQSEQVKDKELEAKIEQEMQRQRDLEAQLANSAGNPAQQKQADPREPAQKSAETSLTTVAMNGSRAASSKNDIRSQSPTSPFKNVEVKDINGDGNPDLWIYYNPLRQGEIVRQEEATHWDGRVDAWSYFKDGKLVRREVDTKGTGAADTVYYYDNDKMVREERDEKGNGYVSFRAIYQNGRRAKLEEDTKGQGKTDHWIYYDTTKDGEIVLKEERDLDGDGTVDLWSYYEDGRLVRRDLSAVGMALLSQQDRLPSSPSEPTIFRPQLVRDDQRRN